MAFIGQALGAGNTTEWHGAGSSDQSNFNNPVSSAQAQQGLAQQSAFIQALQAQGGIQNQNQAYAGYQGLANGTGPNPAQAQLAQATQANVANQAAQAAGQRGASQNVGMIARGAANQGANIQQQAAGQAATMGAQQQVQGLQGMAGIAGQQVNNLAGAQQNYNQNNLGSIGAYNGALGSFMGGANTAETSIELANNKNQSGLFGGLLSGGSGILSDERAKTNVKPADAKIKDFLDKAGAHEYSYKDPSQPGAAPGKQVGPMAQELEQSELGAKMVNDSGQGKSVDFQRGLGTLVAALASLNKRLDHMEGKKPAGKEAPQKMAAGGAVQPKDGFGIPQFGQQPPVQRQPNPGEQAADTMRQENPAQSGANQLGQKIGSYVQPYVDQFKQNVSNYFNNTSSVDLDKMSDMDLNGVQNPRGVESLDGSSVNSVDPFDAPLDASQANPMQVAGTDAAPDALGSSLGAGEAGEGAVAASDAAGAAETAEAAEGLGAASELGEGAAILAANKGAKASKKVPALVSPGEAHIPAKKVAAVAQGKESVKQAGMMIPGKAKISGDSLKNDTVKKTLNEGDVIVPRSKMKDPHDAAAFVQRLMFHHQSKGGGKK